MILKLYQLLSITYIGLTSSRMLLHIDEQMKYRPKKIGL